MTRASLCVLAAALLAAVPRFVAEPGAVGALASLPASQPERPAVQRAGAPETEASAPSPGARVERLAASGDPRDAMRAFRLIERCVAARESGVRRQIDAACRDITAAQLRNRIALLETAARAGVPGAATAWTGAGPFGDKSALTQRPDDPLVVAWVADAVELIRAAAARDDVAAITQLGWLTVNWDMSDGERMTELLAHAAEWEPRAPEAR